MCNVIAENLINLNQISMMNSITLISMYSLTKRKKLGKSNFIKKEKKKPSEFPGKQFLFHHNIMD
jgi:hypothetical protein